MSLFPLAAYSALEGITNPTDAVRPPHFPDPAANPIAILEAALAEKDEIIATQYREMTGWRTQLEAALAWIGELENKEIA